MSILVEKKEKSSSDRGLTFTYDGEHQSLSVGTKYKYIVNRKTNSIIITPAKEDEGYTISRKQSGEKIRSLIDLRNKAVRKVVSKCERMEVLIFDDRIIVKLITGDDEVVYDIDRALISSINDIIVLGSLELSDALKTISIFCGSGMFDLGFERANFDLQVSIDYNEAAIHTYNRNLKPVGVCASVYDYDYRNLPPAKVLIGCPSCKPFSMVRCNRNEVDAAQHEEAGNLDAFIEWSLSSNNDYDVLAMENVANFASINGGYYLNKLVDALSSKYELSYGIVNAYDLGGAQNRRRFVMIASKIGGIQVPTDVNIPGRTVGDVLSSLEPSHPNYFDFPRSGEVVRSRMSFVGSGENYTKIPIKFRSSSRFSNSYRRLSMDEPSPTIVHARKCVLIAPIREGEDSNRIVSVAEAARIQGLDNDFVFYGSLDEKYQQVSNGVPYEISNIMAKRIYDRLVEVYKQPRFVTI